MESFNWKIVDMSSASPDLAGHRWVEVVAHIRFNETGEVRDYITHEIYDDDDEQNIGHPSEFNWEENNYSCDHNRVLFFNEAGAPDAELQEDEDANGMGTRFTCFSQEFSVNLENPVTGEVYYREFD